MSGQIDLSEVFSKRLEIVQPSVRDLEILGRIYCENLTLGAESVVKQLQNMNKQVYILSAGYRLAIEILANYLAIPKANVFAVDLQFDDVGRYQGLNSNQLLIKSTGKKELLQDLGLDPATIAMIGDGANDLVTLDVVALFIGFLGGRGNDWLRQRAKVLVEGDSLLPVVDLVTQLA